jgi:hypothetical protein
MRISLDELAKDKHCPKFTRRRIRDVLIMAASIRFYGVDAILEVLFAACGWGRRGAMRGQPIRKSGPIGSGGLGQPFKPVLSWKGLADDCARERFRRGDGGDVDAAAAFTGRSDPNVLV